MTQTIIFGFANRQYLSVSAIALQSQSIKPLIGSAGLACDCDGDCGQGDCDCASGGDDDQGQAPIQSIGLFTYVNSPFIF